jgi:hypothetical protein
MFSRSTESKKKHIHKNEIEYVLKLHYYIIKSKHLSVINCCRFIRSKTGGRFTKYFFYNMFRSKLIYSKFSTILLILEYCGTDFTTIEKIEIPESYRRKYIK